MFRIVVRLRNFAPFNAMLLQMQKSGLSYAASAHDWRMRFGRTPKYGARPLLILSPFGPVADRLEVSSSAWVRSPHQESRVAARVGESDPGAG